MSIKQFQMLPLMIGSFLLVGNLLAHPLCSNGDGGPQRVGAITFKEYIPQKSQITPFSPMCP